MDMSLILSGVLAASVLLAIQWGRTRQAEHRQAIGENEELMRSNRSLRMAARFRHCLLNAESAEQMMAEVCRAISEEGGYPLSCIGLAASGGMNEVVAAEMHGTVAGRFAAAAGGWRYGQNCGGMAREAMQTVRLILRRDAAAEYGFASALSLPIPSAGGGRVPTGVLCIYSSDFAAFGGQELAVLEGLAGELALAMKGMQEAAARRTAELAQAFQANFVPSTGLANRTLFYDRMAQALVAAERSGCKVAVLALTLDRYRGVKASLGHEACDALLTHMAGLMRSCLDEGHTVAHLLGNEFAVIVGGLAKEEDVLPVAAKLLSVVKEPMRWRDTIVTTTASIGIAVMTSDGSDASTMLRTANSAMAQALGLGGNRFRFVSMEMNERVARMLALEAELRRALMHQEFIIHYQPRVALNDGGLAAAEALVRWDNPARGLLQPGEFMAAAESSGLVVPLGAWALREVCRQQSAWREAGLPVVPVSINLSARQFQEDGLVEHISVALEEYSVPASMLAIEISESLLGESLDQALARLDELRAIGVKVALCDFGKGQSSLARLRTLQVDRVMIDRSVVRELGSEQSAEAICRAIIDVGHNLNMQVVGEGVESLLQREWLRAHHCDEIQGRFSAEPMPAQAFTQLLAVMPPRSNTMLPLWRAINHKE